MFGTLLDTIVQSMGDHYDPGRVWLVVNVLLPFLLFGFIALVVWSIGGRFMPIHAPWWRLKRRQQP